MALLTFAGTSFIVLVTAHNVLPHYGEQLYNQHSFNVTVRAGYLQRENNHENTPSAI
ncbi:MULTISPECIES: hypothetical protein [Oceanimonas]|uniref:Uncharacterized protein n=1 Tax=Oceanimonas smirnovii TaxID=264574 RepID=A0ABW7P5Q1_9GAMM|nr:MULTISPECIES: hypothetical protein [Oceanimonas]MDV2856535.1 hypothetical protein [Oceanimonas sp. CAM02]